MTKPFSVSLKAGERIFINGAVLRANRKVSLEFLNEVAFLLEQHVMGVEDTTTPFRQLYFIVQTMLIDPSNFEATSSIFATSCALLGQALETEALKQGLLETRKLVDTKRYFDALKVLRGLFPVEDAILTQKKRANVAAIKSPPMIDIESSQEMVLCR